MSYLKCLGSSSEGNCYILECDNDSLIIELGIAWKTILEKLNFGEGFKKVRGCLVSHL